ncbi:hypothetical protein [Lacrimispora sp. JR3]|uniref:hypothetical protein n=1 Tax=Lacrimispora sinapis TaxID=3111456 RepID=UPI003748DDF0
MTNFEALKQMPMKNFANLVFSGVKSECNTLTDFEEMLQRDFAVDLEGALQQLQHPQNN